MKSAAFGYAAPTSLSEALVLLSEHADKDAKLIAGGQSLMPLLALRFAQPGFIVDLNRIPDLAAIRGTDDGGVAIGAMTRTRQLETDPLITERAPLAAESAPLIAHRAIRNRGTVGGAVAHADPAAELPAVMLAHGATIVARGPGGTREIRAADFFRGYYTTDLAPDEILVELRLPPQPAGTGTAFLEISRRHGDFAVAGVAAAVTIQGDACTDARIALIGVADRPFAANQATAALIGGPVDTAATASAAAAAAAAVSPNGDLHASPAYRRALVETLVRRAVTLAASRAAARESG
ncbi:MAG TPA: xanthine dehydrogenase family protein subunit M [Acidothermaceae bacterium]|nr:xanthine dehydrogenase family protein subunit M [Acidothermaceae bacterium]